MARGWRCPGGHDGSGTLPLPSCPICGLPVAVVKLPEPEPEPPKPLPVPVPAAKPAQPELSPADLAFSEPRVGLAHLDWEPPVGAPEVKPPAPLPKPYLPPVPLVVKAPSSQLVAREEPKVEVPSPPVVEEPPPLPEQVEPPIESPLLDEPPPPPDPEPIVAEEPEEPLPPPVVDEPVSLALLSGDPPVIVPTPPPPPPVRTEPPVVRRPNRWLRRNRVALALAGVPTLLAVAGIGLALSRRPQPGDGDLRGVADQAQKLETGQRDLAAANLRLTESLAQSDANLKSLERTVSSLVLKNMKLELAVQKLTQTLRDAKPGGASKGPLQQARELLARAELVTQGADHLSPRGGVPLVLAAQRVEAKEHCQRALAALKPLPESDDRAALQGLLYAVLGLVQGRGQEADAASQTYREAVQHFEALSQAAPKNATLRQQLAIAQGNLGTHLLRQGQRESAGILLATARAGLKQSADPLDLARLATQEALALIACGELAAAEKPLTDALSVVEELSPDLRSRPDVQQYRLLAIRDLLFYHNRLTRAAEQRGDARASARHLTLVVDLHRQFEKAQPPLPADATWGDRLLRFWDRVKVRDELAGLLGGQAVRLWSQGDHEGTARCVTEMRSLLAPTWPGWVEYAALLSHNVRRARNDARLSNAEQQRLARQYGQLAIDLLTPLSRQQDGALAERFGSADFDQLRFLFKADFTRLIDAVTPTTRSAIP